MLKVILTFDALLVFLVSWGGVWLSPLGTAATLWPIVTVPDNRWRWVGSSWCNENWQGKPRYSEKTYLSAALSSTNTTWPDLGSTPSRPGGQPATNRLTYGKDLRRFVIWDTGSVSRHNAMGCYRTFLSSLCLLGRFSERMNMKCRVSEHVSESSKYWSWWCGGSSSWADLNTSSTIVSHCFQ
jgi:hypothetical protein